MKWSEGPSAAVTSLSRGPEGQKTRLPLQMDLGLRREKEIKSDGKTKS